MNRTIFVLRHGNRKRPLRLTLLVLFTALLAVLAAQPGAATQGTLAGETFNGGGVQTQTSGACNTVGASTFTWSVHGTADGPVAGAFSATLTVTLDSMAGPASNIEGTFEINGGAVTGTISLPAPVTAYCLVNDPGYLPVVVVGAYPTPTQLHYTVTSPFSEHGELPVTEFWAAADNSVFGFPIIFFNTDPFVPGTGFGWTGFLRPIENTDADGNYVLNLVKAGQGVPVKFSLDGDQGLAIFADGYPQSSQVACDTGAGVNTASETVTAGGSSLSYDTLTDTYNYIWKTNKAWAGTCRQFDVVLADGTTHSAQFQFN